MEGISAKTLEAIIVMRPKPAPVSLVRIGGDADGAYLVPDDLDGVVACFSPGVNNRKAFEDELDCYRSGFRRLREEARTLIRVCEIGRGFSRLLAAATPPCPGSGGGT